MRLKSLFFWGITLFLLLSVLTTLICYMFYNNDVKTRKPLILKKRHPPPSELCKGCREVIDKVRERYNKTWIKQLDDYRKFRIANDCLCKLHLGPWSQELCIIHCHSPEMDNGSELSSKCHGINNALITQANTPVGAKIVYDGEKKRSLQVTPEIFSTFPKEHPFPNKIWGTCAVVGNGGILSNSSCGKMIDSAEFVIRCNLPPVDHGYENDVGMKTDLVTANPSILINKFRSLQERRRPFVESLRSYGNSLLLLPAFSYGFNTPLSLRVVYSIEDFKSPTRPVFFNPEYLESLGLFWRSRGLKAPRASTGLMMASLALEHCTDVHLYGFWPFGNHPQGLHALTNHYYDDVQPKNTVHAMPVEFEFLLQLHSQGVLRLHLEDCEPGFK